MAEQRPVAFVTGASSGFGLMIARDLAHAGHVAYASMRDVGTKNADVVRRLAEEAGGDGVDIRTVELDVQDEASVDAAVRTVIDAHGRLAVLVHNAGHMVYGPAEAFTPEQLAHLYDVNVLGTQRVNRAVLPHMRAARAGLLVWVSSTSVAGGVPPLLGPLRGEGRHGRARGLLRARTRRRCPWQPVRERIRRVLQRPVSG